MKTLPLSEAKAKLSGLVDQVMTRDAEFLITRNGRPAAMLVSADEIESWKATAEILADPEFMGDIRRGTVDLKAGRSITLRTEGDFDRVFGVETRPRRSRAPGSRPRRQGR